MRAAVLNQIPGKFEIQDVRMNELWPNEVRLRVVASGLCHSDLHFVEGKFRVPIPAVLGHEASGIVEDVGDRVTIVKPGDHVIACASIYCGKCRQCLTGHSVLCENKQSFQRPQNERPRLETLDGRPITQHGSLAGFAESMIIHENSVVKIRDDMPLDRAAMIGCGVSTGLGAIFHTARVEPGSTVAVLGCGGIGLSAVQGARIAGAGKIIAIDTLPIKLAMAKEFGATDLVDASKVDPVNAVRELTNGGVQYSFEAIGMKKTAEQAFQILQKGGTATIIGMVPLGQKIELEGYDLLMERKVQGSVMGSINFPVDIPMFVDMYLRGQLKLDQLLSQRIALDEINEGYAALKAGKVIRSIIVFDN